MFKRIGEATIISVLNKESLLKNLSIPKAAGKQEFCATGTCPFQSPNEFDYDPERYLYFRARAITAGVPNKNGDYFSWDELKKAYQSFIGKGFYINHESDHPSKAKGLILDARLVEAEDTKYIETLVAVDKVIAPEVCQLIESGLINSVSMGCLAAKAKCSMCGNIAMNVETLCDHMNPGSKDMPNPHYVKGRVIGGNTRAFEENYDISFTELSGVSVPADSEAHIFEIFASEKQSDDLLKHYDSYIKCLAAKENKKEDKVEDVKKPIGKPETKAPDTLENAIDKVEDQMPKKVIEFFMKYINDSVMKLLKVKLGDEAAALQATISNELSSEIDKIAEPLKTELKKFMGKGTSEPKVSDKLMDTKMPIPPSPTPGSTPGSTLETKPEDIKSVSGFDMKWFKKTYVEPINKQFTRKADADVLEMKPEQILNIEGYDNITLQYDGNHGLYRIIEDGKELPGFVEVKVDDIEDKKIKDKTESMDLILRLIKGKEGSNTDIGGIVNMDKLNEVKQEGEKPADVIPAESKVEPIVASSTFDVLYVPGYTPANSFFVGKDGDKVKTVSASLAMPANVQQKLLEAAVSEATEDPLDIPSPEEVVEQIKASCGNNFDQFCKWAEELEKNSLSRTAEWAINEAEIMDVQKPKAGEVIRAVDSKEAADDKKLQDMPSDQGSKVKQYFGRLPSSGPGEQERALNLQSDVNEKYHKMVEAYEKEKSERIAAEKQLEDLKTSGEEAEKERLIASIVSTLQTHRKIANEDEKKEVVAQLAGLQKGALESMIKLLEKTSKAVEKESFVKGDAIPQVFATFEDQKTAVDTMAEIWNR